MPVEVTCYIVHSMYFGKLQPATHGAIRLLPQRITAKVVDRRFVNVQGVVNLGLEDSREVVLPATTAEKAFDCGGWGKRRVVRLGLPLTCTFNGAC